jgi:Alpha amylase, catalytic domain
LLQGGRSVSEGISPWWRSAIIYQVYVPSFQDGNGDGVGDLLGLLDRLDYFTWLGIDALWLSPVYPSPRRDGGYDVADYYRAKGFKAVKIRVGGVDEPHFPQRSLEVGRAPAPALPGGGAC